MNQVFDFSQRVLNPEQKRKLFAFRKRVYEECEPDISRSTVAIYGHQNDSLVVNGSGVLLRISDTPFLLSAAHVLDYATIHNVSYYLSPADKCENPVALNNVTAVTSPIPARRRKEEIDMRDDDPLDIGFVELDQAMIDRLPSSVDVAPSQKRGFHMILGFPSAFSHVDAPNRCVYSKRLRYVTELCDSSRVSAHNDVEIFLNYPKDGIDNYGNDVLVPNPKGISGCGIWRLAGIKPPGEWKRSDCKLVGIEHTWGGDERFIKGTRLKHVLKLIYRRYPPLRGIMDLHLGLATAEW